MKSWGLGRCMVRQWEAIDRRLWIVAVAYALTTLARYPTQLRGFCAQAAQMLRAWRVVGRAVRAGKLAEAISPDFQHHRRAWLTAWRC